MTMREAKRKRLEAKGWKIGNTKDFLNLAPEEFAYIEMKLKLADSLRKKRQHHKLSQMQLAKLLKSSQSRIAKMEAGDPSVSIDLLVRSLLMLGVSKRHLTDIVHHDKHSS